MKNKTIMCVVASGIIGTTIFSQCVQAITNDEVILGIGRGDSIKYAKDNNGVTWFYSSIDNETATIYGTNDSVTYVEVPEKIDGLTVEYIEGISVQYGPYETERINPNANKIEKIKIPSSVKSLASYALDGCHNVKEIEMPEKLINQGMTRYAYINCPNVKINGSYHPEFANLKTPDGYKLGFCTTRDGHKIFVTGVLSAKKRWFDYNNKRYYFYTGSSYMATGFIRLGNVTYYLDEAENNLGNLVTGWKKINDKWYYFSPTAAQNKEKGYMVTGWFGDYYFYGNGTMATGFINLNGAKYYLDLNSGVRKTGWQKIQGSYYYFAKPGEAQYVGLMSTGWKKIGGEWYYFDSLGKMAHDTYIDGYHLGSSGAMGK